MHNLEKLLLEACSLASKTMLRVKNSKEYRVDTKGSSLTPESSVLTSADIATEKAITEFFAEKLPEYNFIGEEFGNKDTKVSKVIVTDPIDCTLGFTKGLSNFGTIIGIYEDGMNIAGAECNATTGTVYVATQNGSFKRYGPDDITEKNTIYIESPNGLKLIFGEKEGIELNKRIVDAFKKEFPNANFIIHEPHIFTKCRVFSGKHLGAFHAKLSRHDLAAAPIFAKKTGGYLSDHVGVPLEPVDFHDEIKKYATKDNKIIYSLPMVIAQNEEIYSKMLKALSGFKKELDIVKHPEY